jgi:hypothetical protein
MPSSSNIPHLRAADKFLRSVWRKTRDPPRPLPKLYIATGRRRYTLAPMCFRWTCSRRLWHSKELLSPGSDSCGTAS